MPGDTQQPKRIPEIPFSPLTRLHIQKRHALERCDEKFLEAQEQQKSSGSIETLAALRRAKEDRDVVQDELKEIEKRIRKLGGLKRITEFSAYELTKGLDYILETLCLDWKTRVDGEKNRHKNPNTTTDTKTWLLHSLKTSQEWVGNVHDFIRYARELLLSQTTSSTTNSTLLSAKTSQQIQTVEHISRIAQQSLDHCDLAVFSLCMEVLQSTQHLWSQLPPERQTPITNMINMDCIQILREYLKHDKSKRFKHSRMRCVPPVTALLAASNRIVTQYATANQDDSQLPTLSYAGMVEYNDLAFRLYQCFRENDNATTTRSVMETFGNDLTNRQVDVLHWILTQPYASKDDMQASIVLEKDITGDLEDVLQLEQALDHLDVAYS